MRQKYSILVVAAAALTTAGISSCRSRKMSTPSVAAAASGSDRREDPYEAHGANIRIVPRVEGRGKPLILAFCYEQGDDYDPQIWRVRIGPVSEQKTSCTISAVGDAYLWNEWKVGDSLSGFAMEGCGVLLPGEYEVYAYGRVGNGVIRISLEQDGRVRALPWDKFTAAGSSSCPRIGDRKPRFSTSDGEQPPSQRGK